MLRHAQTALLLGFINSQNVLAQAREVVRRPGEPPVVRVAADDSAMVAAIVSARASVSPFVQRVVRPAPTQSYAGVKVRVDEGPLVEHLWMSHLTFDGTRLRGIVGNSPIDVKRVKMGDTLLVLPDSVSDWMLVDKDTVFGAFSFYVLRDLMTPSDRAEFDRDWGVHFGARPRPLAKTPPRH